MPRCVVYCVGAGFGGIGIQAMECTIGGGVYVELSRQSVDSTIPTGTRLADKFPLEEEHDHSVRR